MSDVDQWLSDFESALSSGDSAGAAALFHEESFWRDLVAFTWNLKTVEGPGEIEAMLDAQLEHVQPSGWHTTEPPDTADGDHDGVDRVRDRGGARQRAAAPARRQGVDVAHGAVRAQGP